MHLTHDSVDHSIVAIYPFFLSLRSTNPNNSDNCVNRMSVPRFDVEHKRADQLVVAQFQTGCVDEHYLLFLINAC